ERASITPSHLNKIEKGTRNPPQVEALLRMIEALRLTKDEADELVKLAGYSPHILGSAQDQTRGTPLLAFGGFDFPTLISDEDALLEEIRGLFDNPRLSQPQRADLLQALKSIVEWLRFRYNKDNEK